MAKAEMTLESYMTNVSEGNKQILMDLFRQVQKILPNHTLSMKYKFSILDGYGKFGLAEKSGYIALYFHHDKLTTVVEKYHNELGNYKIEKESLPYKKASDIPIPQLLVIIDELFNNPK
jgi:hypothetical protein